MLNYMNEFHVFWKVGSFMDSIIGLFRMKWAVKDFYKHITFVQTRIKDFVIVRKLRQTLIQNLAIKELNTYKSDLFSRKKKTKEDR